LVNTNRSRSNSRGPGRSFPLQPNFRTAVRHGGINPKGLLIFTENGYFSSQIVRSDLPKFASNNRAQGTPEENKAVVQGSSSTFGTYTVNETKKNLHAEI
jgi:hypothetical protein